MTNYSGFAYVYDVLMADVPYQTWANYIDAALQQKLSRNREDITVLDLACGTGNMTIPLAQMGYDMIGVDMSADMLAIAQSKLDELHVLFIMQDMRELDLYGTVDAVVCTCDSLNYLLDKSDLEAVFKRVKMFLNPGGVFIFDMKSEYLFKNVLAENTFTGTENGVTYEWSNRFNSCIKVNEYRVVFKPDTKDAIMEIHHQTAYPVEMVCDLLLKAGFNTADVRDGYSESKPNNDSMRIVYIAS